MEIAKENDDDDANVDASNRPTMETLTNTPWRRVWPPVMDAFLTREYQRTTTMERKDFEMEEEEDDDGGGGGRGFSSSVTRVPWDDDEAVEIRRLRRVMMRAERGMDMDEEQYTPGEESGWTREKFSFEKTEDGEDVEEDPTSEAARELRCVNKIMDMLEKDLRACLPALRMFRRMDRNIDAFEAFVDDMERRFEAGTLPKRDVLGEKLLFRWRMFVLSGFVALTAIIVGVARAITGVVSSRL